MFSQQHGGGSSCWHGVALSEFQLGHLYQSQASILFKNPLDQDDPSVHEDLCLAIANMDNPIDEDNRLFSKEDCLLCALTAFEQAYQGFCRINHLAGMAESQ